MKRIVIPIAVIAALAAAVAAAVMLLAPKEEYRLIKVNSYNGSVMVQREKEDGIGAFEGMKLISGDSVNVGAESFLELLADSDKHICAEADTGFLLSSGGTEKNGYITIELLYGKSLFTIDNKLPEGSFFDVKTPNVTLSVRGTSFSVEYDRADCETRVEVFSGKVLASYYGTEQVLEAGETLNISSEDFGLLPSPEGGQAVSGDADFMISRYFQNVPDYITSPAELIEFYYCSDNSRAAAAASPVNPDYETVNPVLSESMLRINEEYIDTVSDRIMEAASAEVTADYLNNSGVMSREPMDITDWYRDFASRTAVINDNGSDYTVEFKRVTLDWLIADMTAEYAAENYSCLPMSGVNAEGRVYCLTGINITFSADNYSPAPELLTPPPISAYDGTATAESFTESRDDVMFTISSSYIFTDMGGYSSANTNSTIQAFSDSYAEEKTDGRYNPLYPPDAGNPLDTSASEIYLGYIEPHREEIEGYLEENDEAALKVFEEGGIPDGTDVTDWFPERMTLYGSSGDYN
ncbi:MAG: FecR domain-containing protein [Ruminiclostridium sp.]